jgi:cytochrome b561
LTRFLHWVVAILVLATLPVGVIMLQDGLSRSVQNTLFILHKNGGVIILLLVVLRILWRATHPAPPLPASVPAMQARLAKAAHWALYAALLTMAISGYVRVRAGGFPIEMLDVLNMPLVVPRSDSLADTAKAIHSNARYVLAALILVHVGAAVSHLRKGDGVFARIWPPLGSGAK